MAIDWHGSRVSFNGWLAYVVAMYKVEKDGKNIGIIIEKFKAYMYNGLKTS